MSGNPPGNHHLTPRRPPPPNAIDNRMPRPRDEADVQYQMLIRRQANQIRHLQATVTALHEQNLEYVGKIKEDARVKKKLEEDHDLFREVARFYVGVCFDHCNSIRKLEAKIEKLTDGASDDVIILTPPPRTSPVEPVTSTTLSEPESALVAALRAPVAAPVALAPPLPVLQFAPDGDDDLEVLPTPERRSFAQIIDEWRLKDYSGIPIYESYEFLFNPNGSHLVPQPVKKVTNYFAFYTTVLTTEEILTGDYKYRNNKRNMWNESSDAEKDEWRIKFNRILEIQKEQRNLGWIVFKKCPDRKRAVILEKRPLFDPKKVKEEPTD